MTRLTKEMEPKGTYAADDGCTNEVIQKLGRFENLYYDILADQEFITVELEKLRSADKMKTYKFKELMGRKLLNNHVMDLFKLYGLL